MADGNICIIGPRGSGKTTYLAALAFHEKHQLQHNKRNQYIITAQNPESHELVEKAKNILIKGSQFERTEIGRRLQTVADLPFFQFTIEGKENFYTKNKKIEITARDYPGEIFDRLSKSTIISAKDRSFWEDCFINKIGCLMMLSDWEGGADSAYERMMKRFIELMEESSGTKNYKLAIVMTKCERGELWTGRMEPELDLFQLHLADTTKFLRKKFGKERLKFFAVSTFGTLRIDDPRPNRKDSIGKHGSISSVLRQSVSKGDWKPYNLIEPLYWLLKS
jgi:energy-coupling factor transporter ATP-binding protein EcfA2